MYLICYFLLFFFRKKMSYSYQVYVGNLSTAITTEQLKNLFSQVGQVLNVWIKTKASNLYLLKKALLKDLRRNKEIVDDFAKACVEMEQITFHDKPETIKTAPEVTNLDTLTETIKRYFKPPCKKDNWQVDIDLSKGKRLTAEENDKFFNLKLTKPRPCAKSKKENYFSLDYRTVND